MSMPLRSFRVLLLAVLVPLARLGAQGSVVGTLTDSVNHRPLAGALVQLVADAGGGVKSATSDSLGGFRIEAVAPGSYIIGFFHPTLDSLGIDLLPKRVVVRGAEQRVDLAVPSAWTVVTQLCPATPL